MMKNISRSKSESDLLSSKNEDDDNENEFILACNRGMVNIVKYMLSKNKVDARVSFLWRI